jgi:ATP-binding cassette, subfamily B, bacterial MsbA
MNELRRFLKFFRGYETRLALSVTLILSVTALTLPYPLIIRAVIDQALPNKDWEQLKLLMILFGCIFLARGTLAYFNRVVLQGIGMRITCDLRKHLFAHLQTLSVKYYENRQTGKIASRVAEDTGQLFMLVTDVLVNVLTDTLTLLAVLLMLFWIQWELAVIVVAVLPFFLLNYRLSKKKLRKLSRRHRRNWDRVLGFLYERVASARLVKSFSMEEQEIARFNRGIENDFRNFNSLIFQNVRLWVVADMISSVGTLMVLLYGGWLVIRGSMTIGDLMAFITYIGFLFAPIVRLNDLNAVIQRAVTSLEKIYEVLDTPSFVVESSDAAQLPPVSGLVEFRDVQFSYEAGRKTLSNISLAVEPGQMVALVGPSGAGKTTLINLLCRFYDVDQGSILIDGMDIRKATVKSLRQQIGFVMQESLLFSGTLLDNIRYGLPGASLEDVVKAAQSANAHDFIRKLPRGYHTSIGERGVKLSGGQKQRIAIARAILKDPRILIFDEATSSLDSESERLIQDAMERLLQGRTSFIIAHRLSTVLQADKIVVLDAGEIREEGTHRDLLQKKGVYRKLYDLQFYAGAAAHA